MKAGSTHAAVVDAAGAPTAARRRGLALALLAGLASFVLVIADLGEQHYGLSPDELAYHEAARRHVHWLERLDEPGALDEATLDAAFGWNPEVVIHPGFSRLLSGLSWRVLHVGFGVDEIVALRLPWALAFAAVVAMLVGFAWKRGGLLVALVAMLFTWGDIRFFGHAHVAMPDGVLAALWLAATLVLAGGCRSTGRCAVAALLAGLAVATKFTGVGLVAALAGWILIAGGRRRWAHALLLGAIPLAVVYGLHPQAWQHPLAWAQQFMASFTSREANLSIPTLYFGQIYGYRLPWHAPLVHLLITTPPTLLLAALGAAGAGIVGLLSAGPRAALSSPWTLLVGAGLLPLVAVSLPGVPAHDQDRLFLATQPFLVLFAAEGFLRLARSRPVRWLGSRLPGPAVPVALAALLTVPPLVQLSLEHPFELSYFNTFIGGIRGADAQGFDLACLKLELNGEACAEVNAHIRDGESLVSNYLHLDLQAAQERGALRPGIRLVDGLPADFVLTHARKGWLNDHERELWRTPPVWALNHRGEDLIRLYRLSKPRR